MSDPQTPSESNSADGTALGDELSALVSSATLVLVGGLLASGATLVEQVLIGRYLSPDLYGEVSMALAVMSLGVTLSMAGFSQGIPRFLSRADTDSQRRGIWLSGVAVTGVLAVVITVALSTMVDPIAARFFETSAAPDLLRLFVYALPLVVGFRIAVSAIRGHENTIYRTYVENLLYPGGKLVVLWTLLALGYGIYAAGYAYLSVAALSAVAAYFLLNRLTPLLGPVETPIREMARYSAPLTISTVLSVLLTQTDTMMLGYFESSRAVGMYGAAYPLATGLLVVLTSVGFLYLPLASRLDAEGNHGDLETIYALTTKWVFIVTFPALLLFVVFPGDTLSVFFGPEYAAGGLALAILSAGFFTNAVAGRTKETVSAFGATTAVMIVDLVVFSLNVALNLLLIPRYSFVGAAAASAVANFVLTGSLFLYLRRRFDMSLFSPTSRRTFLVLPVLLFPPTVLLASEVTITALLLPVFLVATGLITLAVVALTGCLQPEDAIFLDRVENALGREIPWARKFLPEE